MRIAIVAAVLLVSATALAQSSGVPNAGSTACTRENGCFFTPCFGTQTAGTAYYFCDCKTTGAAGLPPSGQQPQSGCTAGSDAANGLTPATAKQTYGAAQALFGSLGPDDRILFCNGGVVDDTGASSTNWVNTGVSAAHPIIVGTYDAAWGGGGVRPVILNALGTYAFNLTGSDTPKGGYVFAGLDVEGIGKDPAACADSPPCGANPCPFEAFFAYNQVNDVTICDVKMAWHCIGMEMAGGNNNSDDNQRFTIRNSTIVNNDAQGFLGSGSNLLIDSSFFDYNGKKDANLDHHIYYSSGISTGSVISNNELYRNAPVSGGGCAGVALVTHGIFDGLTIVGNWIHEPPGTALGGCYGIGIMPGYTSAEMFAHAFVLRNFIQDVGGSAVEMEACHNCSVEGNIFTASATSAMEAVTLTGGSVGTGDWTNDTISVQGNTAYGAGVQFRESDTAANISFGDNVTYRTESGTVNCFDHQLSTASYTKMDRNWCYAPSAGTLRWNATGTQSLATWQGATGFDSNSTSGTDPKFASPTVTGTLTTIAAAFKPQSASGLRAAGSSVYVTTTDFGGGTRPNPPAIGAMEFTSPPSTPASGGKNRPITYGGWFLLTLFVLGFAALAGHLSVRRRRAELADAQHVHLIDEHTVPALREVARDEDIAGLMINDLCDQCGEPAWLPRGRKRKG